MGIAKSSDRGVKGVTGRLERVGLNASSTSGGSIGLSASGTVNKDGTATVATLQPTASTSGGRVVLRDILFGRVAGVRFYRDGTVTTMPPFDMIVDGVAYPVDDVTPRRHNQPVTTVDSESLYVVDDDLPDHPAGHSVEVIVNADATATRRLLVHGWLGESGRGYAARPQARIGSASNPTVLTTTATTIQYSNIVSGLTFSNSDTVDRLVTIAISGTTYATITVPAGKSATYPFPSPRTLTAHTWKADANSVINAWTESI